jgi:hypothetical protein
MGEMRNAYSILVGKYDGKKPLVRLRRSWKDAIKMVLREIWWRGVRWIHLDQNSDQWRALGKKIMNFLAQ